MKQVVIYAMVAPKQENSLIPFEKLEEYFNAMEYLRYVGFRAMYLSDNNCAHMVGYAIRSAVQNDVGMGRIPVSTRIDFDSPHQPGESKSAVTQQLQEIALDIIGKKIHESIIQVLMVCSDVIGLAAKKKLCLEETNIVKFVLEVSGNVAKIVGTRLLTGPITSTNQILE